MGNISSNNINHKLKNHSPRHKDHSPRHKNYNPKSNDTDANLSPRLKLTNSVGHLDTLININAKYYDLGIDEQAEYCNVVSRTIYKQMLKITNYKDFCNVTNEYTANILNYDMDKVDILTFEDLANMACLIIAIKVVNFNDKKVMKGINNLYESLLANYQKILKIHREITYKAALTELKNSKSDSDTTSSDSGLATNSNTSISGNYTIKLYKSQVVN